MTAHLDRACLRNPVALSEHELCIMRMLSPVEIPFYERYFGARSLRGDLSVGE